MANTITIGISFSETKYANYPAWIMDENKDIEIVELSWEKRNQCDLRKCQGLLLTGGIDIDPFFYQPQTTIYANQPIRWSRMRDQFELDLFNEAQLLMMPVLGVCRGLQLVNIALGGTLLTDIETEGKPNHRNLEGIDPIHPVQLEEESLLESICDIQHGIVNSAHHQAIGMLAKSLYVNCFSEDGLIEGVEWKDRKNHSPLLCVQWHPERMENTQLNPLSKNIREWFLEEATKFKL